jgi:ribosomal-protein-alanine N-acetyltransferase
LIRPATPADIPSVKDLERACATAAHWTEQQYCQMFQVPPGDPQRLVLVTVGMPEVPLQPDRDAGSDAGTSVRGFLVARHLAPDWELENIVVAATARRIGLGKRLLDALFAAARETNSHSVFLEVRESNMAARALYEETGFEPTARRKAYYADPVEDAILYCKTLN